MKSSTALRRRILGHLLTSTAVLSTGCIVPEPASADPPVDAALDASSDAHSDVPITDAHIDAHTADASSDADLRPESLPPIRPNNSECGRNLCQVAEADGRCATEQVMQDRLWDTLEGSGCCQSGPFGPFGGQDDAPCCYHIDGFACEGRPFLVAQTARLAPSVRRSDWQ